MSASNHAVTLTFQDDIAIIKFGSGQKRFTYDFMKEYSAALDKVESNKSCKGLISTGEGKFFSNGLDVTLMFSLPAEQVREYTETFRQLIIRVLTFPIPTVAAINGHAFAGGCFLALAHDYRVMISEKGWISLNEVLINMRLNQFLIEIVNAKVPNDVHSQLMVYGKRFTAQEAKDSRIVDSVSSLKSLISDSVQLIRSIVDKYKYNRDSFQNIKLDTYNGIIKAPFDFVSRL